MTHNLVEDESLGVKDDIRSSMYEWREGGRSIAFCNWHFSCDGKKVLYVALSSS